MPWRTRNQHMGGKDEQTQQKRNNWQKKNEQKYYARPHRLELANRGTTSHYHSNSNHISSYITSKKWNIYLIGSSGTGKQAEPRESNELHSNHPADDEDNTGSSQCLKVPSLKSQISNLSIFRNQNKKKSNEFSFPKNLSTVCLKRQGNRIK